MRKKRITKKIIAKVGASIRRIYTICILIVGVMLSGLSINSETELGIPAFSGRIRNGTSVTDDLEKTYSKDTLSANWDSAEDKKYGISKYWYAIGTYEGGTNIAGWTDNGQKREVTVKGLNIAEGTNYYFSVYAENSIGLKSTVGVSKAQTSGNINFMGGIKKLSPEQIKSYQKKGITVSRIAPSLKYRANPALPSSAKNWQYLPVVGNQGSQGSCLAFAVNYYYKTYQEAKERGWQNPNYAVNPDRVFSPSFGYNLANDGVDCGSWFDDVIQNVVDFGNATYQDMPYGSYTVWPSETAWKKAIPYKAESYTKFLLNSDAGINNMKQQLANGDLLVMGIYVYANFYSNYPNNTAGIDNQVVFDNSGNLCGGHAIAVIGYDDNKAYNDGTGTKHGAFLLVNSWGNAWGASDSDMGTRGFFWLSYDYVKNKTPYTYAYIMTDKIDYAPTVYGTFGLNHAKRNDLSVTFQGGNNSFAPDWSFNCLKYIGGGRSINQNIVVDLTPYPINYNNKFYLRVDDSSTYSNTGTLTYMSVQKVGSNVQTSSDVPVTTINDSSVFAVLNYDGSYPMSGTVAINGGAKYTTTNAVTLSLTATDADGVTQMQFSNNNITYSTAEAYTGSKVWTLDNSANCEKTVYAKFKDSLGHWIQVPASSKITLDENVPTGAPATPFSDGQYCSSITLTIKWTNGNAADPESGIAGYYLQIGTTPGGNDKFDGDVGNTLVYAVLGCGDCTTYFARVKAKNGAGLYGGFSSNSTGVLIDLTAPTGVPAKPICKGSTNLEVNWTSGTIADQESGIGGYYLQVGTSPGWNDKFDGYVGNVTSYNIKGYFNGTYFARIRAKNGAGGYGNYSDNSEGTKVVLSAGSKLYGNLMNPSKGGKVNIQYTVNEDSNVKVTVHKANGETIKTLFDQPRNAGLYTDLDWDGKDEQGQSVGSGVYLIFIDTGHYKEKGKVIIAK